MIVIGDPLGYASNGELSGTRLLLEWKPDYITTAGSNAVFGFNTMALTQHDQQITIADDASLDLRRSLSPQSQFTVSTWVYWNGPMTGAPWATILTKGVPGAETYGLYVKANGALGFGLYRYTHEKSWWVSDSDCADADYPLREFLESPSYRLQEQTWVQVAITFGNETMRIYADGIKVAEYVVNPTYDCAGLCSCRNDTTYLMTNIEPLRIALDREPTSAAWPFRGMMDEVQVFGRQMTPTEVDLVHQIGVCSP